MGTYACIITDRQNTGTIHTIDLHKNIFSKQCVNEVIPPLTVWKVSSQAILN
jgi:hypothetical protein